MIQALSPAAEFEYSPRARELFADLQHAGTLPFVGATHASPFGASESKSDACVTPTIVIAEGGSREQSSSIRLQIAIQNDRIEAARYQAYGCPHFLAACESLARWLEGRTVDALSQWQWRELETELQVPTAKRARLLLLDDVLRALQGGPSELPGV